jgi:hypothetical protein
MCVVAEQGMVDRLPRWKVFIVDRAQQFLVIALASVAVAQYAAGMVDEAQCLFDVPLAVAGLCVIFTDESAQRRTHFLVARRGEDAQRVIQRRLHAFVCTARK